MNLIIEFIFEDRMGTREVLKAEKGEKLSNILIRNHIPPSSVIVTLDDQPFSDDNFIQDQGSYKATLIEGYDIGTIKEFYDSTNAYPENYYLKSNLLLNREGFIKRGDKYLNSEEFLSYIKNKVLDTCKHFNLINKDDKILIGLSGGVDSSSLLITLDSLRNDLDNFNIIAATFEDYDSKISTTYLHAKKLSKKYNVDHNIIKSKKIEEIFHLSKPLNNIMPELMKTKYSHFVMYIDHHTTRRALEVFAESQGIEKIALGLHTSDIIAGLFNSYISGYEVGGLPLRNIGKFSYIFPLIFILKKELHLYYYGKVGRFAKHSSPNLWELNPLDRNFYYYLSDIIQYYWPGIEYWLINAHINKHNNENKISYSTCSNCHASILNQNLSNKPISCIDLCDVCSILLESGYINK